MKILRTLLIFGCIILQFRIDARHFGGGGGWHGPAGGHRWGGSEHHGGGHHEGRHRFVGNHPGVYRAVGRHNISHGATHNHGYYRWNSGMVGRRISCRFWSPFWVSGFYFLDPFNPFWGSPVYPTFGFAFGDPCFYPRFGMWYHRDWGCWYYPWNRCWFYPSLWYWYSPTYGYSVYYDRSPVVEDSITYRSLLIKNTENIPMYYAVYWIAKTGKKVVGEDVKLYRLNDPKRIDANSSKKILVPPATSSRDRVVIMAKTQDDLAATFSKDAIDSNNIVIPLDNHEMKRISGEASNNFKETDATDTDNQRLDNIENKIAEHKQNFVTIEETIKASGSTYKKEAQREDGKPQEPSNNTRSSEQFEED